MRRRLGRRSFLRSAGAALLAGGALKQARPAAAASFDPFEKSIAALQAAMTDRQTTSAELVQFYLDRIAAYDQDGPRLNALLYVNPNAAVEARALDDERRRRGPRSRLHGIPVLLKDNFDTHDMPTTGGALALSGVVPREDAFQISQLRKAGAVILGKVNLHELALGLTTLSSLGGQTLDPYDVTRAPGGSSGGSGVAVAANFAAFAMGTDTSGSIRIPSSHNAIVGLRPSAGLSSRTGIIPFGHTQDTGGPMARTVEDIAIVLDATVGYDTADPATAFGRDRIPRTYTSSLKRGALKGARIGVLNAFFGDAPDDREVGAIVRGAIDEMKRGGVLAIDVTVPNLTGQLMASSLLVQELKFDLADYLRRSPAAPVKSIEELLASGLYSAQLQGFLDGANAVPDDYLQSDDYKNRHAARVALGQAIVKVMDDNRLVAIAYPTTRRVAPLIGGNQIGSNAGLSAQTGFPAITVPAGFTPGGFPVGIELLGRQFAEPALLGLAYAYEQATHHHRPPPSTPPLAEALRGSAPAASVAKPELDAVTFQANASGAEADMPFALHGTFSFSSRTRQLTYDLQISSTSQEEVGGIYLHRRANRRNGGVAHILSKSAVPRAAGRVTLTDAEASDLKTGKFYVSATSKKSPLLAARLDLRIP
jgi:Asp-tRNA(Asn)/Glu-tRNA(Gln) amidotransferase A subunit family amidase